MVPGSCGERHDDLEAFARDCMAAILELWILYSDTSHGERLSALIDRGVDLFPPIPKTAQEE